MDDFTEVENQVSDSDGPRKKRKSRLHARFEPETFTAIASDVAEGTEMESADTVQETTKETRTKKKKKSKKSEEFDDAAIAHLAAEGLLDDHASISAENQVTNDIHEKPRKKKKSRKDQEESTAENEQDGLVEPTDGQQETGRKPKGKQARLRDGRVGGLGVGRRRLEVVGASRYTGNCSGWLYGIPLRMALNCQKKLLFVRPRSRVAH